MADGLRSAFTTVTETVFPGTRTVSQNKGKGVLSAGNYLASNLPLQVLLYFNSYYSAFWMIICIVMFVAKYEKLSSVYKFVLIVIYIIMGGIEAGRIYLGYAGNLQEKVPELAGFWLVTFILQLPLTIVLLLNNASLVMPMERAAHIILLTFIVLEIVQGYRAIKALTEHQVEKFHMRQFDDMMEMEEISHHHVEDVRFRPS